MGRVAIQPDAAIPARLDVRLGSADSLIHRLTSGDAAAVLVQIIGLILVRDAGQALWWCRGGHRVAVNGPGAVAGAGAAISAYLSGRWFVRR